MAELQPDKKLHFLNQNVSEPRFFRLPDEKKIQDGQRNTLLIFLDLSWKKKSRSTDVYIFYREIPIRSLTRAIFRPILSTTGAVSTTGTLTLLCI